MAEQMQLDTSSSHRAKQYRVCLYKNGNLLARTMPHAEESAKSARRSLVALLRRSPSCHVTWEEYPRSTGWFGLDRLPQGGASSVYHASIEPT